MLQLPPRAGREAVELGRALSLTPTAATVLFARGLRDVEASQRFLEPRLAHLTPPVGMKGRAEAVGRLSRAVKAGERICVFGDYDADGVTAAALMTGVLRALGGTVVTLLADRFDGGYGLSEPALDRVLAAGASVLVTCDCGSTDHERLDRARRAGVDAVVIDHHRVPADPLPVLAFLNPHRPECGFGYKGLASVGLALSVAAGVRAELGANLDLRTWLDLVAIGTIGDVAPLDGDNRALVRAGLGVMARGGRPGTKALAEVAGFAASTLTGEDVSFRLAPRINAPGRLGKPDLALELLLAHSDADARRIAAEVEAACTRRKEVQRGVVADAMAAIVLARQGWHPGVVGIVAGRLASTFRKPAIVIALEGERGRGSARGPAGFSVYDALAASRAELIGFGGHHAAAGVEIAADRVDVFRDLFCQACVDAGVPDTHPRVDADAVLEDGDRPERVARDLERFEPCGQANAAPRIAIDRARVLDSRELTGGHMRLTIDVGGSRVSCFGAEMGDALARLGSHVRAVGSLRRDAWRGGDAAEIRLTAVEPA
jgi:single-stranded-DNA-specific exonuclease